jgi:hypothetical protein
MKRAEPLGETQRIRKTRLKNGQIFSICTPTERGAEIITEPTVPIRTTTPDF